MDPLGRKGVISATMDPGWSGFISFLLDVDDDGSRNVDDVDSDVKDDDFVDFAVRNDVFLLGVAVRVVVIGANPWTTTMNVHIANATTSQNDAFGLDF